MSFYWIYNLPNWMLCLLIVSTTVGLALAGLLISRPMVKRLTDGSSKHNDLVSYFLGAMGVFYGLALGLIAVATWENYTEVDAVVTSEAAALTSLYRDLDGYPQPLRGNLEGVLREYTRTVIEKEWPAHKQGIALEDGDLILDRLENEGDELRAYSRARENCPRRSSALARYGSRTTSPTTPGCLDRSARGTLGGGPDRSAAQRPADLSVLGRELQASRHGRGDPRLLHRASDFSHRGHGQPVSRRIQRKFRRLRDDP